jgi:DNA-binding CsgD family transcriptional regulator
MRMTRLALLTEADLRGAFRLVNEARELPRSSPGQLHHVTRGLAAMTGAQVGIAGEMDSSCNIFPTLDFGWSGDAERGVFAAYAQGIVELPIDPVLPHLLLRSPDPVMTVLRQDLIGDRDWYRSAHVQELRRAARVDACLYVTWRRGPRLGAVALHRAWGEPPMGDRERALADAVLEQCVFLRQQSPLDTLPLRLREVLGLLSRGLSEKQVAADLDLSVHTVHDHVKALHRRLGVQSRGELLALALRA